MGWDVSGVPGSGSFRRPSFTARLRSVRPARSRSTLALAAGGAGAAARAEVPLSVIESVIAVPAMAAIASWRDSRPDAGNDDPPVANHQKLKNEGYF